MTNQLCESFMRGGCRICWLLIKTERGNAVLSDVWRIFICRKGYGNCFLAWKGIHSTDVIRKAKTVTGKYYAHEIDQLDEILDTKSGFQKIFFRTVHWVTKVLWYTHREVWNTNCSNIHLICQIWFPHLSLNLK